MVSRLLLLALLWAMPAAARECALIEVDGPIGPAAAEYVSEALGAAARAEDPVALLRVDTPGGLDASMRRMVQAILASPVPVLAWVGPSGARAASAGLFLVAAAPVAAMAPGTNLGAAHPVTVGGSEKDEVLAKKVEQDAAAYLRALAQQRGRDWRWFERAVTESASISAEEALRAGVVDLIARDPDELLAAADGRRVDVGGKTLVLRTKGLRVEAVPMTAAQRGLQLLSDPTVAYLLMILGFLGFFFELSNPGSIFPGVVGGLALILAFVGLQTLSFSYAGVLLMLLGLVLFLLEVKITSHGLLTVGGVLCLFLGSLLLFRGSPEGQRLSLSVIVPAVAVTAVFFLFIVSKGLSAQRAPSVSGAEALVRELGRAVAAFGPEMEGKVFVHGEYWNARARENIAAGALVEVVSVEGLVLLVRPAGEHEGERRT